MDVTHYLSASEKGSAEAAGEIHRGGGRERNEYGRHSKVNGQ